MRPEDIGDSLQQQMFGLSPRQRQIGGAVAFVVGATTVAMMWQIGWFEGGSLFLMLIGAAAFLGARSDLRKQARFDAEIARAKDEWEALRREFATCKNTRQNVARMLQQRGYREFEVRRWLVRELGDQP